MVGPGPGAGGPVPAGDAILSVVVIVLALLGSHRWPEHSKGLAISATAIALVLMLLWMMRLLNGPF